MLTTLILKKYSENDYRKGLRIIAGTGILSILFGFILRKLFIISEIQSTPVWGLICIGVSMILFTMVYWLIEIKKYISWATFLKPVGENSLTAFLAANIIYYIIRSTGIPILIYKQSDVPLIVIIGSVVWALLIVGLTTFLVRFNIKLKL